MIDGIQKLEGELRLYYRDLVDGTVMMLDDRWTVTKIDELHYRVSPSLLLPDRFHTTNPFIIEVKETKLTYERQRD